MSEITPAVSIGEVSVVNAHTYKNHGTTSTTVNMEGGSNYISQTNTYATNYHHHEGPKVDDRPALQSLLEHSAMGALHSSGERVDAPKCHEQTREAVQKDILSGLSDGDGRQGLVWLTGPAGCGKTAIVGTVCDRLKAYERVAAAFYFSSHKGSVKRKSKSFFVATLAYQMQNHPVLGEYISDSMFSAIRRHPGIFEMDLKTQMEELILKPFRSAQGTIPSSESGPWVVAADGIDECGEEPYEDSNRSREKDQVEVLCCLLQAIQDAAFPCRVVIASRPEKCIRRFFEGTAAPRFLEIFLDDKYSPNDDIALYLRSSFARLCREHEYDPSFWPKEWVIQKLAEDASGQFIYAATVIRFIDSSRSLPKDQLEIILRLEDHGGDEPFRALDALYIAILNSSACPSDAVLWLKAIKHYRSAFLQPSAWTIDRLFESTEGQARMMLELPSLLYQQRSKKETDYSRYSTVIGTGHWHGDRDRDSTDIYDNCYTFYPKSFLDFLEDPSRCQAAFPDVDDAKVERWTWARISKILEIGRPVAELSPLDLKVFRVCLVHLLSDEFLGLSKQRMELSPDAISRSDPMTWISTITCFPGSWNDLQIGMASHILFVMCHNECRPYRPCTAGCKRWRRALLSRVLTPRDRGLWKAQFFGFLDRFCIRRLGGRELYSLYNVEPH